MNLTYKLISFLGSPFIEDSSKVPHFSEQEKMDMYEVAKKNKVGLFFLQRLEDIGELSSLENNYKEDMDRYTETLLTAVNLSTMLSKVSHNFAIFKFVKPYPHTPSDIDVLFFLSKKEYSKIVDYLIDNGYFKIGECPSQVVVYDLRGGLDQMDKRTVGGKKGGRYYIDLYKEVGASHVIYVNKETISDYKVKMDCEFGKIQTLNPIAELLVVLTHSIIPEQLFTMADYYTTLYYIKKMNKKQLKDLAQKFKENNITKAGIASLSFIGIIHKKSFGFIPKKIIYLLGELGIDMQDYDRCSYDNFVLPYRYSISTFILVLLERMKNQNGMKSILTQIMCSLHPRLIKWLIRTTIVRRTRETY